MGLLRYLLALGRHMTLKRIFFVSPWCGVDSVQVDAGTAFQKGRSDFKRRSGLIPSCRHREESSFWDRTAQGGTVSHAADNRQSSSRRPQAPPENEPPGFAITMPDWRALLRLKSKRSPSQSQKATPPPAQASPSTSNTGRHQSSHQPPTSGSQTQTDKVSTTVANGLKLALRLLKESVTGIGVPGLEAAVSGVVKVIDIIENVRDNDKDLESLSRRISGVAMAVSKSPTLHPNDEVPETLRRRMKTFLRELEGLLDEVEDILSDRNLALRTANSEANRDAITEINTSIDQLVSQFTAEGIISLELNVAGVRQDVAGLRQDVAGVRQAAAGVGQAVVGARQGVRAVESKVDGIGQRLDGVDQKVDLQAYEALIQSIPRVKARYNDKSTKPSRSCHRGTRTDLLQGINKWIDGGADDTPYLWLCGEVGVGKTTVAHTIAEEQEYVKQLGASFFFSRHERDRQDPHLLFPSIAYQLARFDEGVLRALAEILKPDPDIVNRDLPEQLNKLILEPLSRSGMAQDRTVVIVIDGLDECSDPASVLDALALGVKDVSVHLRVLVCSRPYAAIQAKFKNTHLYHLATQNHFHDINPETLSKDVAAFLTWSLREIAARPANRHLPTPWPAEDQLVELIDRASGLFIVGSTYTKYIDDPVEDNPAAQLKRILSRKRGIGSSPLAELDALYDQVLDDLKRTLKTAQDLEMARDVIECVILAQSEMSMITCSCLLTVKSVDVRSILRRLTAVILLPEDEDGAITPFHASFGEYIKDDIRCTIRELSVDTVSAHDRIAARCIALIVSAARDGIIGVEYEQYQLPLDLNYASKNLSTHIASSSRDNTMGGNREISMQRGVWTWLNFLFTVNSSLDNIKDHVERAGFKRLLQVEGLDIDAESGLSIGKLMIAKHASAINSMTGISFGIPIPAIESAETRRSKGIQIVKFSDLKARDYVDGLKGILSIVRDAHHWNMHKHPDLVVEGVMVDFSLRTEVQLLVRSPSSLRGISSLSDYLARMGALDRMSKMRLTLKLAKGIAYLHESPCAIGGWLVPDFILVSAEGNPVFAPGEWSVAEAEKLESWGDVDSIDCQMLRLEFLGQEVASCWFSPEGMGRRSLPARRFANIWDFGSILFQLLTATSPGPRYRQLVHGKIPDILQDEDYQNTSLDINLRKAHLETAVSLLLGTIEGFEDVKAILKACWAFNMEDRPSMRVVVERLEKIIQAGGATL